MNPITFNFTGAIQNYTVPVTGTYDLSGFGAGGGSGAGGIGGSGAQIGGTFNLTAGQQLQIIVGGSGGAASSANGAGGGGFSEILVNSGTNGAYVPLVIAGGGGGASGLGPAGAHPGGDASVANPGTLGAGGFSGAGGGFSGPTSPAGTAGVGGGGGAGATSNGTTSPTFFAATGGQGGMSAANGAAGGAVQVAGGFGGGGGGGGFAGNGSAGGGGGGGGSMGGRGGMGTPNSAILPATGGDGGTSYISNTGVQNFQETLSGAGISTGNGSARINLIAATPTPTPTPTPAPCYVTGTRIRVLRGRVITDVPVERLRVGDLAITTSGKPRPIRWIGRRGYPGHSAPAHDRPVRIRAGALAAGVPARDLLVSPDHCLFSDGLFVAAGHLVNGTSITRGEAVVDLTYWHIELDTHDLLLAEGAPAESFLPAPGVRAGFDGVGEAIEASTAPAPYAPRIERDDPRLDALRARLILRSGLSVEPTRFGAMRAWLDVCDGQRVAGWAVDDGHPGAPVCLDIVVDGAVVAMAFTQDHRADLAAAGLGDGRCGFDIALDEPLASGVAHTVEVRRSADGLRVAAKAVDAAGAWTALLAA